LVPRQSNREAIPEQLAILAANMSSASKKLSSEASSLPSPPARTLPFEVDVSFVSDEEIAVLNADYRNRPRPTDVLSFAQNEGETFPMGTGTEPPNFRDFPQSVDGFGMLSGLATDEMDAFSLGDIVISIETAWRQARDRDHDLETEVSFLLVHGALHLLGYDHATSAQRRAMWKQQDEIVARLAPIAKENY
jgi:probable rRNA maturation factor